MENPENRNSSPIQVAEPLSAPSSPSPTTSKASRKPCLLETEKPVTDSNGMLVDVPHLYENYNPGCIRSGFLLKRHKHTGFFSRRYVEVHGGHLTWTKPGDMKANVNVSSRGIAGGSVMEVEASNKLVKVQGGLNVFMLFMACDSRKVHIPPLIFAAESREDMLHWMQVIRMGTGWMYHGISILSPRLCGLIVVEIISVENVLVADWGGKSDPYVSVDFNQTCWARTVTQYETLSAKFSQILTLPVYADDPNFVLTLMVFDEDAVHRDDLLGGVSLPLHSLGFNKEIVWDSVGLKGLGGSIFGKQAFGGDRYGSISFRTIYKSSKLTQMLPMGKAPETKTVQVSVDPLSSDEEGSPKTPARPASSNPQSPQSPSPPQAPVEEPMEFSIELMKLQLQRVVAIFGHLKFLKSVSYLMQFRDPAWSLVVVGLISWVLLIEPASALMFWYALLGKLMLQAHPCYGDLATEVAGTRDHLVFLSKFSNFKKFILHSVRNETRLLAPSVTMPLATLDMQLGHSKSVLGGGAVEYRVFECQRRRIANAMTVLSTMVKVPANVAVAAGTAVASPLMEDADPEDGPSTLGEARKDIANLFKHFSAQNLQPCHEAEWVSLTGIPLADSPATIVNQVKVKWTVEGWEYARALPPLLTQVLSDGSSLVVDEHAPVWGEGTTFTPQLKLHRHWVRRRLWVGQPLRPAFDSEDPVRLSDIMSVEEVINGEEGLDGSKKSIFAKFKLIMEEGAKLQNTLFKVCSQVECLKNLVSWKSRWISSSIFFVLLLLFVLSILLPQRILIWVLTMLVLLDSFSDQKIKKAKSRPLVEAIFLELRTAPMPEQWKLLLSQCLTSPYSRMTEVLNEVAVSVLVSTVQKAAVRVFGELRFVLTPADFGEGGKTDPGGPLTWGHVLEAIYVKAAGVDWWKTRKTTLHVKNLIKGHLVSDWEQFDPSSLFSKQK